MKSMRALLVKMGFEGKGECLAVTPDPEELPDGSETTVFHYYVASMESAAALRKAANVSDVESIDVKRYDTDDTDVTSSREPQDAASSRGDDTDVTSSREPQDGKKTEPTKAAGVAKKSEPADKPKAAGEAAGGEKAKAGASAASPEVDRTIRVDLAKLDALINLTGELVIAKAGLTRGLVRISQRNETAEIIRELDDAVNGLAAKLPPEMKEEAESVKALAARLRQNRAAAQAWGHVEASANKIGNLTTSLQNAVLETRMVPVGTLFRRFTRVVRDLAKSQKKEIVLELMGEETELDKKVIDELVNPMTHLIRNSVDHGVETPETRKAAGKSEKGTIVLNAFQKGQSICIEIRDDGGGLNVDRIKEKAVEKGLFSRAELDVMPSGDIFNLIFHAGFSTAKAVTDVSGRGVGMDVVKRAIETLKGSIDLESELGSGTTITLKLPLTLAIITAFLFRRGDAIYCVPLEAVDEIIEAKNARISNVDGKPVVRLRDSILPIVTLERAIGMRTESGKNDFSLEESRTSELVIVTDGVQRVGVSLDKALGKEEIVIKSLSQNLGEVKGLAGATILGDGRVALILDIPTIVNQLGRKS